MSGGSWDYVYSRIDDAAMRLACEKEPLRRALGKHLKLVGVMRQCAEHSPAAKLLPINYSQAHQDSHLAPDRTGVQTDCIRHWKLRAITAENELLVNLIDGTEGHAAMAP